MGEKCASDQRVLIYGIHSLFVQGLSPTGADVYKLISLSYPLRQTGNPRP